jgi:hypothetical protein
VLRRSHRQRLVGLTVLIGGAGVATGLAAASGVGPFAVTQTAGVPGRLASVTPPAVRADELFPPPPVGSATLPVIQANDPTAVASSRPAQAMPATSPFAAHDDAPRPPTAPPTPVSDDTRATPTPTPTVTSSPTPCDDDGCSGGDG